MRFLFMILLRKQQMSETGLMGFLETSGNCQNYQTYKSKIITRLICNRNIENDGISCPDYEIRFCCPRNMKQNTSAIKSLSYSESDFYGGGLSISYKLTI